MIEQRRRGRMRWHPPAAILIGLLIGLLGATAWNLTRSDAILEARRAYSRGDLALGLAFALKQLDRQPWNGEAALLAAKCLSRLEYAVAAERYYRRAGPLTLGDAQMRAYALVRGPRPELAIPVYEDILARAPENVTAMRRLAAVLLAQSKSEALLKLAERLEQIPSGAVIGSTLRGVVYHNDENPQKAVVAFERVLELDPELREMPLAHNLFWTHLTDDLKSSGRMDDACRHLRHALVNSPDASLLNRLGQMYVLQGAIDDADRCFRQAAELATSDYTAYLNLAKLAVARHDHEDALGHLNRARALSPRRYDVLYTLASVYRQLGRTAEADQLQATLKPLREQLAPEPRASNGTWPRYAL